MTHAARQHAKLAPSAAHRWLECPGSVRLSAGLHEAPSVFAAEGTAAHILAEICLQDGVNASHYKGAVVNVAHDSAIQVVFGGKANGVSVFPVDDEMVEAVQLYLDVANEIAEVSDEFETEQRMDMTELVDGVFGTGDVIAYARINKLLSEGKLPDGHTDTIGRVTIVDLKYGKGVAVDVEQNEQLLTYAAGVAQRYHNRGVDEVELVVVQPRAPHRAGPVRRWTTDVVGLYEHVLRLQAGALAVDDEDAPLIPGPWCKFCKAAAICPALDGRVREIIMTDPEIKPFKDWREEEIDIAMVKGWAVRREEFAHSEALQGRLPPGSKLVGKRAYRQWNDPAEAAIALTAAGVRSDDIFETKVRSPAQIERVLPKKSKSLIGELAAAKSSGTVLAPMDDPRPSMNPDDVSGFDAVEIAER